MARQPPRVRRVVRRCLALLVVLALAAACSDDGDGGAAASSTTTTDDGPTTTTTTEGLQRANVDGRFRLGALLPQTGDLPPGLERVPLLAALDAAVAEVNDAGGVLGSRLVLVDVDSGAHPEVAAAAFARLHEVEGVDAVVGPVTPVEAEALVDRIRSTELPACVGTITDPQLTRANDAGFLLRTVPPSTVRAAALASLVADGNVEAVAIVGPSDPGHVDEAAAVEATLGEAGVEVVASLAHAPGSPSFDRDELGDAGPDAVIVLSGPEEAAEVLAAVAAEAPEAARYATEALRSEEVARALGAADGVQGVGPVAPPADRDPADPFGTAAAAATGDCVTLLALGALAAGSDDPAAVARAAVEAGRDGEPCATFAVCADLAGSGADIHYTGRNGLLRLDGAGEATAAEYETWLLRDGRVEVTGRVAVSP